MQEIKNKFVNELGIEHTPDNTRQAPYQLCHNAALIGRGDLSHKGNL